MLRSGRPELYPEIPDELLEQGIADREQLETILALGMRSVMLIPMVVAGRTIGVLTMVSAESGRAFDEDDLVFAGDLARRAATAVENARLYTERAGQRSRSRRACCRRELPSVAGWELASSYAAGDTTAEVGGDFFDVVELESGFLAVVGDVTGKGVQAAALTALARYTLSHRRALRPEPRGGRAPAQRRARPSLGLAAHRGCAHVEPSASGARMRLTSAGPPAARPARPASADDGRAARAAAGHDGPRALGERARSSSRPATRCSSTPTASPTRRPGASASARSACSPRSGRAGRPPRDDRRPCRGALREFQLGDVVDDRAMLALQLVGVGTARGDGAAQPTSRRCR